MASDTTPKAAFSLLHIDIARHATDDFNPFHDKHRWHLIEGNPFGGPIALGFQSIAFIDHQCRRYREDHDEAPLVDDHRLAFSNLEVTFASAITADETIDLEIRGSRWSAERHRLRNRIVMRAAGRVALTGHKTESRDPLIDADVDIDTALIPTLPDRSFIGDSGAFLKRKYMMTSNAKSFLASSCVEPADYFDEIADRVEFPESYPLSLISSALLERGQQRGHDFMAEPMVYAFHRFATDRRVLARLRSNDRLDIVVGAPHPLDAGRRYPAGAIQHHCAALLAGGEILFQAEIGLMPLA